MPNRIQTKKGHAEFSNDQLLFSESSTGYYKSLYDEYWQSDRLHLKLFFVFILVSVPAILYIIFLVASTGYGNILLVGYIILFVLGRLLRRYRGFRSTDKITVDNIQSITASDGTLLLTRPRFVVRYTKNENTHKRLISMPSSRTSDGAAAFERAKTVFRQKGLLENQEGS